MNSFHLGGRKRRPRLRTLALRLRALADRIYPEPTFTLQVTTAEETRTFVNCRELTGSIRWRIRP